MNPAVRMFQDFQRIHGICPCCGEVFRLSDATLFYKAAPPRTPWDELRSEFARLERAEERFSNDEGRLRDKAQELGRRERDRRLRELMRFFKKQRIELADMKLLFHPVDYIVFRGLAREQCSSIEFLDCEPTSRSHERLQRSIEQTISAGNVNWVTMRIEDDGRVNCS